MGNSSRLLKKGWGVSSATTKLITPSRHTGPSIALRINSSRYPDSFEMLDSGSPPAFAGVARNDDRVMFEFLSQETSAGLQTPDRRGQFLGLPGANRENGVSF